MISLRILVIGDSSIGKSHIIQNLCSLPYTPTTAPHIEVKLHEHERGDFRVAFIKVPSAREFKISRSVFYVQTHVHGLMFVFDASSRRSYEHVQEWIGEVVEEWRGEEEKKEGGNKKKEMLKKLPVLLVGNKTDLQTRRSFNFLNAFFEWVVSWCRNRNTDSLIARNKPIHQVPSAFAGESFFDMDTVFVVFAFL